MNNFDDLVTKIDEERRKRINEKVKKLTDDIFIGPKFVEAVRALLSEMEGTIGRELHAEKEVRENLEKLDSKPYCPACESCGIAGCCGMSCLYFREHKEDYDSVVEENELFWNKYDRLKYVLANSRRLYHHYLHSGFSGVAEDISRSIVKPLEEICDDRQDL